MFDYEAVRRELEQLHQAACSIKGYFKEQVKKLIYVGEYNLALDTIAGTYLSSGLRMPPDLYAVFDHLAQVMELEDDPEFDAVAEFRKFQSAAS